MSDPKERFVTITQVREILRTRDQQAARIRGGLIGLLTEYDVEISKIVELPMGDLLGHVLDLEETREPLGDIIQLIIAPTLSEEPETHGEARRIMGENFFGFTEVAKAFGFVGAKAQAALANIPFDEATLRSCCETHVLVADIGLSIIDVRGRMKRGLFYSYQDPWYDADEFAKRTEQVAWRLIRKAPVPNSMYKWWSDQKILLDEGEEVPTARQLVYAIMLTFATTGERLFERTYVRTSDMCSRGGGCRVSVGGFHAKYGLRVGSWACRGRNEDIGVASSRRSNVVPL